MLPETKSCSRQTGLAVEARSNKSKLPVFHSLLWCLIPFLCFLTFTDKHPDVSVSAWFSVISQRASHGNHTRCYGLYFCCARLFWLVRFWVFIYVLAWISPKVYSVCTRQSKKKSGVRERFGVRKNRIHRDVWVFTTANIANTKPMWFYAGS